MSNIRELGRLPAGAVGVRGAVLSSAARAIDAQRLRRASQSIGTQHGDGQAVEGGAEVVRLAKNTFIAKGPDGALYGRVEEPLYVEGGILKTRAFDDEVVGGGLDEVITVSTSYYITRDDDVVYVDTAGLTVNLPSASPAGQRYYIKNTFGTGSLTVAPISADSIDGAPAGNSWSSSTSYVSLTLGSDGNNGWWIL